MSSSSHDPSVPPTLAHLARENGEMLATKFPNVGASMGAHFDAARDEQGALPRRELVAHALWQAENDFLGDQEPPRSAENMRPRILSDAVVGSPTKISEALRLGLGTTPAPTGGSAGLKGGRGDHHNAVGIDDLRTATVGRNALDGALLYGPESAGLPVSSGRASGGAGVYDVRLINGPDEAEALQRLREHAPQRLSTTNNTFLEADKIDQFWRLRFSTRLQQLQAAQKEKNRGDLLKADKFLGLREEIMQQQAKEIFAK